MAKWSKADLDKQAQIDALQDSTHAFYEALREAQKAYQDKCREVDDQVDAIESTMSQRAQEVRSDGKVLG